jgi:hypothetical protein
MACIITVCSDLHRLLQLLARRVSSPQVYLQDPNSFLRNLEVVLEVVPLSVEVCSIKKSLDVTLSYTNTKSYEVVSLTSAHSCQ